MRKQDNDKSGEIEDKSGKTKVEKVKIAVLTNSHFQ